MPGSTPSKITVVIGDQSLASWQRYQLESDLLTPADAFCLTLASPRADKAKAWQGGETVKVLVDDVMQLVGQIDEVMLSTEPYGCTVEISGRDRFAFLVDCSAKPQSLKLQTVKSLAQALASDWITEWKGNASEPLRRIKIEPGETVFEVLQRAAEKDRRWLWMAPDGTGIIGKPNYSQAPLYNLYLYRKDNPRSRCNNVIYAQRRRIFSERYSEIFLYGSSVNTDKDSGLTYRAKAVDAEVGSVRPLVRVEGHLESVKQAQDLADRDVAQRKFDSLELTYTVKGHYGYRTLADGRLQASLWAIDTLADIEDEPAGISGTFYLVKRRFVGDETGQFTELTFRQKDVWLP